MMNSAAIPPKTGQLQMVWPQSRLDSPPSFQLAPEYKVRLFRDQDGASYCRLMTQAGFEGWNEAMLAEWRAKIIPKGFFVVEYLPDGSIVATAMALHRPASRHPEGGELGWVAANGAHKGKGLGCAACAAVVARFIEAGYSRIYLLTDDFRLPAVKIYLRLGFLPFEFSADMAARWKAVCGRLELPYNPLVENDSSESAKM